MVPYLPFLLPWLRLGTADPAIRTQVWERRGDSDPNDSSTTEAVRIDARTVNP
jgi:hypothetical protein